MTDLLFAHDGKIVQVAEDVAKMTDSDTDIAFRRRDSAAGLTAGGFNATDIGGNGLGLHVL